MCLPATSVTLVPTSGYEYSLDGKSWQNSATFNGLSAGTAYTFYQRVAATATSNASASSAGLQVTTKKTDTAAPAAPVAAPPPPPAPAPVAAPLDFKSRYAPSGEPDPLANLQALPELAPDAPVADPQNMSEGQNHAWAALRAQSNANRRAAEDYRRKYNSLAESTRKIQEEHTGFGAKLNEKDKQIEALQNEIGRLDLSRSPEFQSKYDDPLRGVENDIARTLVDNGMQQSQANELARDIMLADRREVPGMLTELPPHAQGIIMISAEKAETLWNERESALENWRSSQQGLASVAQRGSAIEEAQRQSKLVDRAFEMIRLLPAGSGQIPAYQVTDATFVADRDAKEAEFRDWVVHAPEEQKYAAMLEGFMAPKTYEMLDHYARENAELKQALYSRTRVASPRIAPVSGGYVPPPPPPPPPQRAPTQKVDGYSVQEYDGNMAQSFVKGIFAQGGFPVPQGM